MRLITFIILCLPLIAISQVDINSTLSNAKVEFLVESSGSNKGILIPRMTIIDMGNILTPVDGLLVYVTDNNAFYFYNGTTTQWGRIGQTCTIIQDADADTKITVEFAADEDKIRFFAQGVEVVTIDAGGITQNVGDLSITNGTVHIGSAYSLPTVDGSSKFVLRTDGSGNLSWVDPLSLPGLVAGVQSIPLGMGREYQALSDKALLTVFIPWSDITVNTIAVNVIVAGSPNIELGIYEELDLLASGTVSPVASGFISANMTTSVKLKAGTMYRFAIVDRAGTATQVLEYPSGNNLNRTLVQVLPAHGLALPPNQNLPDPLTGYNASITKMVWFCAY